MPSEDTSSGRESVDEDENKDVLTRRAVVALGGLTGLTLLTGAERPTNPLRSRSSAVRSDLNLKANDIVNVGDISMSTGNPSLETPGTGEEAIEIRDSIAEEWSLRATEGDPGSPGVVRFNAPIAGTSPSEKPTETLDVEGAIGTSGLSVDSWQVVDVRERGIAPDSEADLGDFIHEHSNREDVQGAVYYLPEGTYTWNTPVTTDSLDSFGIVGKPQARVECTNPEMPYVLRAARRAPDSQRCSSRATSRSTCRQTTWPPRPSSRPSTTTSR